MLFPYLSPDLCARLARDEFGNPNPNRNKKTETLDKEICESLIGTTYVVSELWNMIDPVAQLANGETKFRGAHPKHLFWGLFFLKNYCTEPVMVRVVGHVDPKSLRKWVWIFVNEIAGLRPQVIVFERRYENWDEMRQCLISIDGVDCAIKEIWPFDEKIFSKKLNGPGYKYEIGICIATGVIVWVNGPFKAGRHDKTIFEKDGLMGALDEGECVEADMGYQGLDQLKNKHMAQSRADRRQKGRVLARHENVNGELKKFAVLDSVFRHDPKKKHKCCFEAVAVICQLRHDFHGNRRSVDYTVTYYI